MAAIDIDVRTEEDVGHGGYSRASGWELYVSTHTYCLACCASVAWFLVFGETGAFWMGTTEYGDAHGLFLIGLLSYPRNRAGFSVPLHSAALAPRLWLPLSTRLHEASLRCGLSVVGLSSYHMQACIHTGEKKSSE